MAKYTQLLAEYLKDGGELPAVFSEIPDFDKLFTGYYCDREIAFETPTLFSIKLDMRAQLVIPEYKDKLSDLEALHSAMLNPTKNRVRTGNLTRAKEGEIKHVDGETQQTTTNTKAGAQRLQNGGNTSTAYDGNEETKIFDEPFASSTLGVVQNPRQAQQVTQHTQPTVTVTNETFQETTFPNYEDKTVVNSQEHTNTESYNNYLETETYNQISDAEEGLTSAEALAVEASISEKTIILEECLKQFETLFLQIY